MDGLRVKIPLYGAALATGGAFSILFTGEADGWFAAWGTLASGGAFWTMIGAALVAALVGSAGRWRFVALPPAVVAYTWFAVYGRQLFEADGWREFFYWIGGDVYNAAGVMYTEPIPYGLDPGLFVVLVPVVMIVVAFATSATLYEGSPVISTAVLGVTIGVLSTISFEVGAGPFFFVFLVCAVALLLSTGTAGPEGPGRAAVVAGAAVVAFVLLVPKMPFSDSTISAGMIDWTRIGTGSTSRLDVQADVGDYLTAGRDAELLRVESPEPLLWRGGTMDYFNGVRWSDTTEPGSDDGDEVTQIVQTRSVTQSVEVLNARTDVLFGGYRITNTDIDADRNSDGSWSLDEPFVEGTEYTVYSEIPQPTEDQLRGAGTEYPAPLREKFLQLPDDTPDVVAETARRIERENPDADTPYEKARAVERYLIYDGGFTYNLDVSYRRADRAIEEFLGEGKEGFCTQFATSMALILREMGIPSRVVYGSTPGEEVDDGEYVVTGSNMHTWVEVYFPGVAWYPFNPTPGFAMPSEMEANAPRPQLPTNYVSELSPDSANLQFQQRRLRDNQDTPERPQNDAPEERERDSSPSNEEGLPTWPLFVLLPALLVGAVPLLKRALLARGRPEDLYGDLAGRLRDVLPPGRGAVADSPALTPTERLLLLAGAADVDEEPVGKFARAYSDHLYSSSRGSGDLSSTYRRAVRAYGHLPLRKRVLGAVNPASLFARARRGASASRTRFGKAVRGRLRGSSRR